MFTGLVEEVGRVQRIQLDGSHAELTVRAETVAQETRQGDSIAVNGVCLTVVEVDGCALSFDAVAETMSRTNLGDLKSGGPVNLERSLAVGQRVGGHFVLGHVDGTAVLKKLQRKENARILTLGANRELLRHIVPKGSVAVDGISLTVVDVNDDSFTVWIIPHTFEMTNLRDRREGHRLNLETDVLAKYVEKLVVGSRTGSELSSASLEAAGFTTQ